MTRSAVLADLRASGFVILSAFGIRISSFTSFANSSRFCDPKHFLLFCLLRLLLPFLDAVVVDAAEGQEFFFIVSHLFTSSSGERVILHQEDRFFRTNLLAIAAENAAEHVNLKFPWDLLRIRPVGGRAVWARRNNPDRLGRTDKFTELAGDTLGVSVLILYQVGRAPITLGHDPFLLGILHRDFLTEEVTQRDSEPAKNRRQVKPFQPV